MLAMDELYFCPDCLAEHTEPLDAGLGHVARCLTCEIVAGSKPVPVHFEPVRIAQITVETNIAA
jgi:hypothetical protein